MESIHDLQYFLVFTISLGQCYITSMPILHELRVCPWQAFPALSNVKVQGKSLPE